MISLCVGFSNLNVGYIRWFVVFKRRGVGGSGLVGFIGVVKVRVLLVLRCLERRGFYWVF